MLFTAQEKQLFLPTVRQCLDNRPDKRPSSAVLVRELRRIESSLPRGGHVAAPNEQLRQQFLAKEEQCRQKDEALREKDEALRGKDATIQEQQDIIRAQQDTIREQQDTSNKLSARYCNAKAARYHSSAASRDRAVEKAAGSSSTGELPHL